MKQGDVIIEIPNGFKVTFEGYIAGQVSTYKIHSLTERSSGWSKFTGTTEELLEYCARQVKAYNKHVRQFGGTLI